MYPSLRKLIKNFIVLYLKVSRVILLKRYKCISLVQGNSMKILYASVTIANCAYVNEFFNTKVH